MTDESIEPEGVFDKQWNEMIKDMIKNKLQNLMKPEREAFVEELVIKMYSRACQPGRLLICWRRCMVPTTSPPR